MATDRNKPETNRKEEQLGSETARNQQAQQTGSGNRQQGENRPEDQIRRDQQGGGSQSGQQRQEGGTGNQPGSGQTRSPQQGGNVSEQDRNRQQGGQDKDRR